MRIVLWFLTAFALFANLVELALYGELMGQPGTTVAQQAISVMDLGFSSLSLIVGVAGLAIVGAIRTLTKATREAADAGTARGVLPAISEPPRPADWVNPRFASAIASPIQPE